MPATRTPEVVGPAPDAFRAGAGRVMRRVCTAVRDLVAVMPQPIGTAAELERALGISKKVAWQVYRIAEGEDPLAAVSFLPGADPVRKLLEAARARRVPAAVTGGLADAFAELDAFVRAHAGDRATFAAMVGGAADDADAGADVDRLHRRAVFRAYSHFVGLRTDLAYTVVMVRGSADGTADDFVSLRVRSGLTRLRAGAPCVVDRHKTTRPTPDDGAAAGPQPLDAAAFENHGAAVLPGFCSRPLPQLALSRDVGDLQRVEWVDPRVGRGSAVDLTLATITRGVRRAARDGKEHGFHALSKIDGPVRTWAYDVLVHAPSFGRLEPRLTAYADPLAFDTAEYRERCAPLPLRERVEHLGRGPACAPCPDYPRHHELVGYACGMLGWDAEEFDLFRVRIEFPLVNSVVRVRFPVA